MPRRDFLATLAGTAAAAAFLPAPLRAQEAAAEPEWEMLLSTSTVQFSSLSIEDACARIAALGFQGVDIWSAYQGCPHLDDCLTRLGPEGLAKLLKDTKLRLTSFSTYVGGYAKYAQLLGKVGGGVAIQGSAAPCAPAELIGRMKKFMEDAKPLLALAEEHDSYLAIENHGSALLDSLDSIKAFTDLNSSKRLGIALAPYHLQLNETSVPAAIEACGRQLFFFYAWEHAGDEKQLPGLGETNMVPWLDALAKIEYDRYVNPFMHGHPEPDAMSTALAKSKAYLHTCRTKRKG